MKNSIKGGVNMEWYIIVEVCDLVPVVHVRYLKIKVEIEAVQLGYIL